MNYCLDMDKASFGRAMAVTALVTGLLIVAHPSGAIALPDAIFDIAERPAKQTVTPTGLERVIEQDLLKRWAGRVSEVAVNVAAPRKAIHIPMGKIGIRVTPIAKVVRPGPQRFRVTVSVEGKVVKRLRIAAIIEAYARVVLTQRPIQRGGVLKSEDLAVGEWRVRDIEHGLVVNPEEAIGKRTQVGISKGRPIPKVALETMKRLSEHWTEQASATAHLLTLVSSQEAEYLFLQPDLYLPVLKETARSVPCRRLGTSTG
jgi:flagella basal body P-ring formation protein FlgA